MQVVVVRVGAKQGEKVNQHLFLSLRLTVDTHFQKQRHKAAVAELRAVIDGKARSILRVINCFVGAFSNEQIKEACLHFVADGGRPVQLQADCGAQLNKDFVIFFFPLRFLLSSSLLQALDQASNELQTE